jgi:hypothetical protein
MSVSFDYYCSRCDATYCERVNLLNLALDYDDDGFCLACLCAEQTTETPQALVAALLPYINSRDCFKKPWHAQDTRHCARKADATCFCEG